MASQKHSYILCFCKQPFNFNFEFNLSYLFQVHHKDGSQYETDGDGMSSTLTIQSGYSSDYRSHTQPLSRLSRHSIKIKSSSSFPNLLSLYQTPIREEVIKTQTI
jgi:hypothetical protein